LTAGRLAPLQPFLLELSAVVLSFFVASMFWIAHWRVFRLMTHSDLRFVALNLAYLGTLTLLPISTSIVSTNFGTRLGSLAYSANLFAIATVGLFLRIHARRLNPQAFAHGKPLLSSALAVALFGTSSVVSLQWPAAACALWCVTLLMPIVENRWGIRSAL
jgi:uncharacterized membrane protein